MAVVPLRLPRDRDALEADSLALSPEDLRLRFGQTMKPEAVAAYLYFIKDTRTPTFGTVNPDPEVVAVGQFAEATDGLEMGLSVLSHCRRRGLATALLERAASYARAHAITSLVMHCLADNAPMLALARRCGMSIETSRAEADGRLEPRAGTALDVWTEAAYDQLGMLDVATKRWELALRTLRPAA